MAVRVKLAESISPMTGGLCPFGPRFVMLGGAVIRLAIQMPLIDPPPFLKSYWRELVGNFNQPALPVLVRCPGSARGVHGERSKKARTGARRS